ncbi:STAS domain-containing protein [Pseudonocardia sp. H11422]|uniref:STAS domain-containing protein n=1 Tax=Pseudonocardia sp. H11422 TaxID=2835866 RepID=UPI001BDBD2CA|nr:STAS domain-containing protein [Pseudonocardia sp. H11422]
MDEVALRIGAPAGEPTLVDPGVLVIRVMKEQDVDTASQLAEVLSRALLKAPWAIVVDMSALDGLDPRAVRVLAGAARWAGELDIGYALAGPSQAIVATLRAAGCLMLFDIHGSPGEALMALCGGPM